MPSYSYGDTSGVLNDHERGGDQTLSTTATDVTLVGDASALLGHASGGDDTLTSVGDPNTVVIGDAGTMSGHSLGGDDVIVSSGAAFGDAHDLGGHARGGADQINTRYGAGDAYAITGFAHGGDDAMTGPFGTSLAGDAWATIGDHGVGGDDTLTGAGLLIGDAPSLSGHARGGNDLLISTNTGTSAQVGQNMYGDGVDLNDHAQGGNDTLIGGSGPDIMFGDSYPGSRSPTAQTGADLFVFAPSNGHDWIYDFEPGKDHIALDGFPGINNFQDLVSHFQATPDGVLISFDANNDIVLRSITAAQLSASDFVFG